MKNSVTKYEDKNGLPISVIVPLSKNRINFFESFVLPLIHSNNPKEIIVIDENETAPKKRNYGFKISTQPYVFFCDDDILLPNNLLKTFHKELKNNKNVGYVYCGYKGIVLNPKTHPIKQNYEIKSGEFNPDWLKKSNYISTMSLIRRQCFPGFDESLSRFQDWDLYLTMLDNGIEGKYISDKYFIAFYLDDGITSNYNKEKDSYLKIRKKHNLIRK